MHYMAPAIMRYVTWQSSVHLCYANQISKIDHRDIMETCFLH